MRLESHERCRESSIEAGHDSAPRSSLDRLTRAERTVLGLIAEGCANAAIAQRLFLSKRTVESHVSRLYMKLGVANRVQLARVVLDGQEQ